jgi:hypothetical protein
MIGHFIVFNMKILTLFSCLFQLIRANPTVCQSDSAAYQGIPESPANDVQKLGESPNF